MTALAHAVEHELLGERLIAEGQITAYELQNAQRLHRALGVNLDHALFDLGPGCAGTPAANAR